MSKKDKKMKWKRVIRASGLIEWQCEHGVGHPDANSVKRMGDDGWGIHGCDGCCGRDDFPGNIAGQADVNQKLLAENPNFLEIT